MRDSAHRVAARIVKKLDIDHVQNKADWKVLSGKKKKALGSWTGRSVHSFKNLIYSCFLLENRQLEETKIGKFWLNYNGFFLQLKLFKDGICHIQRQ